MAKWLKLTIQQLSNSTITQLFFNSELEKKTLNLKRTKT